METAAVLSVEQINKTPLFVLLDATWQQAAKMCHKTLELQGLPLVSLATTALNQYSLRRNQQETGMATVEREWCYYNVGSSASRAVKQYFSGFLERYEAQRSNRRYRFLL